MLLIIFIGDGVCHVLSQGFFPSVAGLDFMAEIHLKWDCYLFPPFEARAWMGCTFNSLSATWKEFVISFLK